MTPSVQCTKLKFNTTAFPGGVFSTGIPGMGAVSLVQYQNCSAVPARTVLVAVLTIHPFKLRQLSPKKQIVCVGTQTATSQRLHYKEK